jgi:nucleoside-diphosphate-sugar epimerase
MHRGQAVRALVRQSSQAEALAALGAEAVIGDVRSLQDVVEAVRGVRVVYHCAALTAPGRGRTHSRQEIGDVNLGGVRNLLEAIRGLGSGRVILLSSVNVLGSRLEAATEELPCHRSGEPYADVMIDVEQLVADYCAQHDVDVCVLRPGMVYGPGDRNVAAMLDAVRRGAFRFIGSPDHVVPLVHVRDLVQSLLLAAETPAAAGRVYHITDGSRTSIAQLVELMAELSGAAKPDKTLSYGRARLACTLYGGLSRLGLCRNPPLTKSALRILGTSRHVDIRRARQELGYTPQVMMREGMSQYVQWLLAQSPDELGEADER